jgi:prepilin-type N-terminal cleavage/methylation domain-containing protein
MKSDSTITRHSGFTLVEMIVAATVMAAVMMGLVQVFRMTTSAVSEANDALEAYQQARGVFSALSRDLAGVTKDGYLRISIVDQAGRADGEGGGAYSSDLLVFTTTGICGGVVDGVSSNWVAAAAEVVYTSNTRVSGGGWLEFPWDGDAHSVRKGVLSRQAYLIYPEAAPGSADYSAGDVAGSPSLGELGTLAEGTTRYNQDYGYMWPYSVEHGFTDNSYLVGWVMATRVGEFKVEYLDAATGEWVRGAGTWGRGQGDSSAWPKALRVTVVIFGPADRAPLAESRNWDADTNKFQGYVFQQIFLLR